MKTKISQAVIGGIVATLAMTMVMFLAPYMGLPKMNAAAMLSMMMGVPVLIGWGLHFMIGIVFALAFLFLFVPILKKVKSRVVKGVIFGLSVFIFAQLMMAVMSLIFGGMNSPSGSMVLILTGGIIGHVIYGIVVSIFAGAD
ncbi:MAG TPA: DUF6789 family protein [Bacteroidales bacterium]|nr:DUF6789 family protein [Bacteroidales bacterium]